MHVHNRIIRMYFRALTLFYGFMNLYLFILKRERSSAAFFASNVVLSTLSCKSAEGKILMVKKSQIMKGKQYR